MSRREKHLRKHFPKGHSQPHFRSRPTRCNKRFIAVFSATVWNFSLKFYSFLAKPSTSNCQLKFDFVEKRRSCRLFNMAAYRFFSIKMFKLQYQVINIAETTQLTIDQIPEFHYHCECSKYSPPAPCSNVCLQSPYLISFRQPCRSVLVAGCLR